MAAKASPAVAVRKEPSESEVTCLPQLFDEEFRAANRKTRRLPLGEAIADFLHSVLVSVLVVSYWRGGWALWDSTCSVPAPLCAVPEDERTSSAVYSEVIGVVLVIIIIATSPVLARLANGVSDAPGTVLAVLQTLLLGTATISLWRGCWYLADQFMYKGDVLHEHYATGIWISHFGSFFILVAMGASFSVLAPPGAFLLDGMKYLLDDIQMGAEAQVRHILVRDSVYTKGARVNKGTASIPCPGLINQHAVSAFARAVPLFMVTRRAVKGTEEKDRGVIFRAAAYVVDVILSVGVVAHLVVLFWRGLWGLFDHYDFEFSEEPADFERTAWVSIAVGYGIYFLELLRGRVYPQVDPWTPGQQTGRQVLLPKVLDKRCFHFLFSTVYTYVMAYSAVNVWRGVWYLMDHYTSTSVTSAVVSHCVGIVGLTVLGALRSIFAPPALLVLDDISIPPPPTMRTSQLDVSEAPTLMSSTSEECSKSPKSPKKPALEPPAKPAPESELEQTAAEERPVLPSAEAVAKPDSVAVLVDQEQHSQDVRTVDNPVYSM